MTEPLLPPEPPGAEPRASAAGVGPAPHGNEPHASLADGAPAPTYESACARVEAIVRRLDSGEAGLRETLELCQEGRRLVEFCAAELEAVGQGLEELRLDELVSRLETGRATAP